MFLVFKSMFIGLPSFLFIFFKKKKKRKRIGNHRIRASSGALPFVRRRGAPGPVEVPVCSICAV
jgi:hypothetical protein